MQRVILRVLYTCEQRGQQCSVQRVMVVEALLKAGADPNAKVRQSQCDDVIANLCDDYVLLVCTYFS